MHRYRVLAIAVVLILVAAAAWAQGMGMGAGISDIHRNGAGTAAPVTFLLLQAGGFVLLQGGGKIQCVNAC